MTVAWLTASIWLAITNALGTAWHTESNSNPSDITYGVAVGYNEMAHVDNNKIVSARFLDSKSTLASTVLFDAEGVAVAQK